MSNQVSAQNPIVKEILQIEREHVNAFNVMDLERTLNCFAEDINGFSSTHNDRYRGRDALKKTFEYYLQKSKRVFYEVDDFEVQMLADESAALVTFYWKAGPLEGVERDVIKGRGTHVLEKRSGRWQIVHEHFSRAH